MRTCAMTNGIKYANVSNCNVDLIKIINFLNLKKIIKYYSSLKHIVFLSKLQSGSVLYLLADDYRHTEKKIFQMANYNSFNVLSYGRIDVQKSQWCKRVLMSLIIRHLEGTAKVFSTFSVNCCVNSSLKF